MAHLWPKSTPIIYFQSRLLFLHENTFPCLNIKSGQSHLYEAIFYCQQLIYMYITDCAGEASEFYFQTTYKNTFQVMFTLTDTQLYKKCTRGRQGTQ